VTSAREAAACFLIEAARHYAEGVESLICQNRSTKNVAAYCKRQCILQTVETTIFLKKLVNCPPIWLARFKLSKEVEGETRNEERFGSGYARDRSDENPPHLPFFINSDGRLQKYLAMIT
jgi:hypothetical protein